MLRLLERNLWLSLALLAALGGLLVATVAQLGGRLPDLPPRGKPAAPGARFAWDPRAAEWFAAGLLARAAPGSNAVNPFYTLHFQPPPPPPPPATKKVEVLYQGCYVSSETQYFAFVKVADALLVLTNGAKVIADHTLREIGLKSLVLTNAAGQTNVLEFNAKKALDVPAN